MFNVPVGGFILKKEKKKVKKSYILLCYAHEVRRQILIAARGFYVYRFHYGDVMCAFFLIYYLLSLRKLAPVEYLQNKNFSVAYRMVRVKSVLRRWRFFDIFPEAFDAIDGVELWFQVFVVVVVNQRNTIVRNISVFRTRAQFVDTFRRRLAIGSCQSFIIKIRILRKIPFRTRTIIIHVVTSN